MSEKKQVTLLIAVMVVIIFLVTGITSLYFYRVALEEERARLVDTAVSQARLIEAVARFDEKYSQEYEGGSVEATLSQIRDAHESYAGFGKTGEFTLAKIEGEEIVFLLRHRHSDQTIPKPVPLSSNLAEPMRLALNGQSGTIQGLDYRGTMVLAAFEPVDVQNWGIVAKIDLTEIRAPFIRSGIIIGITAIILALLLSILFIKLTQPLLTKLSEAEKRFVSIFKHAAVGIVLVDSKGYFMAVNDTYSRIVGYSEELLRTMTFRDITHPDDLKLAEALYSQAKNHEVNRQSAEKRYIRKDGSIIWVALSVSAVYTKNGSVDYFIAVVKNITERVNAQKALQESESRYRHLSENLESLVEERTLALKELQETLIQKERLAVLGELAGGVGHELRNPLGVISNAAYYLKETLSSDDKDTLEYFNIIDSEVHIATQIISDLIDYAENKPGFPQRTNIHALIKEILDQSPKPADIESMLVTDNNTPIVIVDPDQITMAIKHIIYNAFQAMPEGGKLNVEIKSHPELKELLIKISDTGTGISSENIKKVFKPLFSTKMRGIGLGLAITKKLVEINNGKVDVLSKPGKGSTFTIYLPYLNSLPVETRENKR